MRKTLFIIAVASVAGIGLVNAANAVNRDPQTPCALTEHVERALAPHVLGLLALATPHAPATHTASR